MIIKVTQDHINRGDRQNKKACPIALAINEALNDECEVWKENIYIPGTTYKIDPLLKEWIIKFDGRLPVESITINLMEVEKEVDVDETLYDGTFQAMSDYECSTSETLMVGNSEDDRLAAENAGIEFIEISDFKRNLGIA